MVYYAAIINWYAWDPENDSIFSVINVIYIFKAKITFSEPREFFTWTLDSMLLWLCVKRLQRIFGIMSILWEKVPLWPFAFQILSFDHLEETIIQGFRENVLESSNCSIFTDADVTILEWHPALTGWSTGLSIHHQDQHLHHMHQTILNLNIWSNFQDREQKKLLFHSLKSKVIIYQLSLVSILSAYTMHDIGFRNFVGPTSHVIIVNFTRLEYWVSRNWVEIPPMVSELYLKLRKCYLTYNLKRTSRVSFIEGKWRD